MHGLTARRDQTFKPGWRLALADVFAKSIPVIESKLADKPFYPQPQDVFRIFRDLDLPDVKVVIVGQDPYSTEGHANGYAFAVNPDVRSLPRSLNNIFEAARFSPRPQSGDLEGWVKQGVFLLNRTLTVTPNDPGSHDDYGWQAFTNEVIRALNVSRDGIVFLLWGTKAQTLIPLIDKTRYHVLVVRHPASWNVKIPEKERFVNCNHFHLCNAHLDEAIDWSKVSRERKVCDE